MLEGHQVKSHKDLEDRAKTAEARLHRRETELQEALARNQELERNMLTGGNTDLVNWLRVMAQDSSAFADEIHREQERVRQQQQCQSYSNPLDNDGWPVDNGHEMADVHDNMSSEHHDTSINTSTAAQDNNDHPIDGFLSSTRGESSGPFVSHHRPTIENTYPERPHDNKQEKSTTQQAPHDAAASKTDNTLSTGILKRPTTSSLNNPNLGPRTTRIPPSNDDGETLQNVKQVRFAPTTDPEAGKDVVRDAAPTTTASASELDAAAREFRAIQEGLKEKERAKRKRGAD